MSRKLKRFLVRHLQGSNKCLALLSIILIAMVLYNRSRYQSSLKGVKFVIDADGMQSSDKGASCGVVCGIGQKSFYLKTGTDNTVGPTICYDGKVVIGPDIDTGSRGINMAVIDSKTMKIREVKVFDTYTEDSSFLQYMPTVPKESVIIIVTHDEITEKLSTNSRNWISLMGSNLINHVRFRDAYLLIGQIGLEKKQGIEYHRLKEPGSYSIPIEKKGCIALPFGSVSDVQGTIPNPATQKIVVEKLNNCGYTKSCNKDSFTVMVDTGDKDTRKPSICINGEIVVGDKVAGRGFNVAVFNPKTKKVVSVSVFDTYEQDSSSMEGFLENVAEGDIIVALVSDDGQRKLKRQSRDLYLKLGSSMIQNLKFRDLWYFVGRKGIKGFTPYEQISYAGYDGTWPDIMKESFCIPYNLQGTDNPPTPKSKRNEARREFCKKYDGYEHLCDVGAIDEILKGVDLIDKIHQSDEIYKVPIVIIPGVNHNAIVRTMETTLMQPGLNPNLVLLTYDENFPEYSELSTLFGFKNISLKPSTAYEDILLKGIEAGWTYFDKAEHLIVIEEELILAPDFLSFMQQCLTVLDKDPTLLSVSAWNYNGYDVTSGNRKAVYRVEEFPGLAFMIKKDTYQKYISGKESECCHKRVWDDWDLKGTKGDIIIPDVSRVFHQPYQSAKKEDKHLIELFQKPRLTNIEGHTPISNVEELTSEKYNILMEGLIKNSQEFSLEQLQNCIQDPVLKVPVEADSKPNFVIFYRQNDENDFEVLNKISHCFGLFLVPGHPPRNQYRGALRFYYDDRNVILVGSSSKFYSLKPESRYILTRDNLEKN